MLTIEIDAHIGGVNDISFAHPNKQLCVVTCGDDKTIEVREADEDWAEGREGTNKLAIMEAEGIRTSLTMAKIIAKYSEKLRKIIKQEKRRSQIKNSGIEINDFPGGSDGFEMVSKFCYNNGTIQITVSNVSVLHCCAVFLGMTEKISPHNLLRQTEIFLQEMFYWSWNDTLICLKSLESFFSLADSCGLVEKLMFSLLAKIAQNSGINSLISSSSSSSSSSSAETLSGFKYLPAKKFWWFEDLTILSPKTIEYFAKNLCSYGGENNSLVLTRFLLHYLQTSVRRKGNLNSRSQYNGLADTTVDGVISMGKSSFSCRTLFWVMRVVAGFVLSRSCRAGLERLIGGMLDQASLDDLLVSGKDGGVYDVSLVMRLIRLFLHSDKKDGNYFVQKMKKVGRLMDKYLGEIAPDQSLKMSKFLGVAESLPDCARDCFDGVYRAIDIYLESHPTLSLEERSRLCRCLDYEKLTLESCKDLAKNPRVPPRIAVQALASQHSSMPSISKCTTRNQIALHNKSIDSQESFRGESVDIKLNIQRMQWRVVELEKVCREMKEQMSKMRDGRVIIAPQNRALPRMC
ncbi:hypothetical protein ACH5RR_036668 [Cinchona calisaya]|uniref:Phototropic-responsive NPH3 family protein n=1 Tax=Cinchona calisaya TaxID=153742 RepID=A0ABD2Y8E4_9GENT